MFVSVTFPIADFRGLTSDQCGRLDRPHWGSADPRAAFARGFGSIHTRNKSGSGFVGENYYADCNKLIKYPSQIFLTPAPSLHRKFLLYPVYRRFFFDGQVSGRFEFGFRLNEGTIDQVSLLYPGTEYDILEIARPVLMKDVIVNLLDGRSDEIPLFQASALLRDGYIMSSTQQKSLSVHDVASIGTTYVNVGTPFVFIRASAETPICAIRQRRNLILRSDFSLFQTRSGVRGRNFDTVVITSRHDESAETPRERLARLFYTQIRSLTFAHSHYLTQVGEGKIGVSSHLAPSIGAMIERIKGLMPLDGNTRDQTTCDDLRAILENADIDVNLLAREIEDCLRPNRYLKLAARIFGYFDRKADKMIEAAASTATKQMLSSGP